MFVFSLLLVVGGLIADAWLVVTNQVGSFDGLFLFCSSSVIAFAFGLYLRWFIRSAVSEANLANKYEMSSFLYLNGGILIVTVLSR